MPRIPGLKFQAAKSSAQTCGSCSSNALAMSYIVQSRQGRQGKRPEAEEGWNYFGFLTDAVRIGKSDPDGAPKGCPSVHV
jgi:hypothetical protein